jgi:hypothetical protein
MIAFTDMEAAGLLPDFFGEADPRPAREQLHENYAHGGGWHPMKGWRLEHVGHLGLARAYYPGDPPMRELSRAVFRKELLILFQGSWLAIIQPDGSFEMGRCD